MDSIHIWKKVHISESIKTDIQTKKVLAEFLGLSELIIHTVVFFVGDCKFKTSMPPNVLRSGLGLYIKRFKSKSLSPNEVRKILAILNSYTSECALTNRDHVKSLHLRHHSDTTCPRCGSRLVKRTSKREKMACPVFLGCENYPKCRFTKSA